MLNWFLVFILVRLCSLSYNLRGMLNRNAYPESMSCYIHNVYFYFLQLLTSIRPYNFKRQRVSYYFQRVSSTKYAETIQSFSKDLIGVYV